MTLAVLVFLGLALILVIGCEPCAIVVGAHCQGTDKEQSEPPSEKGPIPLVPPLYRGSARG